MTARIRVTSEPKGSNPGGECLVFEDGIKPLRGYFKYCHSSRMPARSALSVKNQPFYEAMTLQLARELGLKTTDFYVLLNPQNDVFFEDWEGKINGSPLGRDCYFVSKLLTREPADTPKDSAEISRVLDLERPYLEALHIDDIINKRQNYLFGWTNENGEPKGWLRYIDLGCSFVRAVGGAISLPKSLETITPKEARRMVKHLKGVNIISADNNEFRNLEDVVNGIREMTIPTLNPFGRVPIKNHLSPAEIEEILGYVLQGFVKSINKFEERGLIVMK